MTGEAARDPAEVRVAGYWNRRRDLERQLHDGPALRIAALTLHLGLLAQKLRLDSGGLQSDIEDLQGQLHAVQQELRAIADQIYPALLHQAGLGPALRELAVHVGVPVQVQAVDDRFDAAVEGVAYFTVAGLVESLGTDTPMVDVTVRRDAHGLALDLASVNTDHGNVIRDHIQRVGGTVEITAGATMGMIKVRIPCA